MRPNDAGRVRRYLDELSAALAPLAADERGEIVSEAHSHIVERLARPEGDLDIILGDLGTPREYAAAFLDPASTQADASAAGTQPPIASPSFAERPSSISRAVVAAAGAGLVSLLRAGAVVLVVTALFKLLMPGEMGVWSLPATPPARLRIHFAVGDDVITQGREILGLWLVPLALSLAAGLWALSRLTRRVLRLGPM
jgi:uncharacterized membrane protein